MTDRLLSPREIEDMAHMAGLSLQALCVLAGVHHTTFYRWRAGQSSPNIEIYQKIVRAALAASSEHRARQSAFAAEYGESSEDRVP